MHLYFIIKCAAIAPASLEASGKTGSKPSQRHSSSGGGEESFFGCFRLSDSDNFSPNRTEKRPVMTVHGKFV